MVKIPQQGGFTAIPVGRKITATFEALAVVLFVDLSDVHSGLVCQFGVKPSLLAGLPVLFRQPGFVFFGIVKFLAKSALALSAGFATAVLMKKIQRFKAAAVQAIFVALCFGDIVIDENLEIALFGRALPLIFQVVCKNEFGIAGGVNESALFALKRKIVGNVAVFDDKKIRTLSVQALKAAKEDVASAFDMVGPDEVLLFHRCVAGTPSQVFCPSTADARQTLKSRMISRGAT
jgi:hypothetical protein